jgi:hypothetical protein
VESPPADPLDFTQLLEANPWLEEHRHPEAPNYNPFGPTPTARALPGIPRTPWPEGCPDEGRTAVGQPLATLKPKVFSRWAWLAIFVALVLMPCAVSDTLGQIFEHRRPGMRQQANLIGYAVSGVLALGFAALFLPGILRQRAFWVCQRGLVWQNGREIGWCPWTDLEQFHSRAGDTYRVTKFGVQKSGEDFFLHAVAPGGRQLELYSTDLDQAKAFQIRFQEMVTAAVLPRFLERLRRGQEVECSPFTLHRNTLKFGDKAVSWSQVKRVALQEVFTGQSRSQIATDGSLPTTLYLEVDVVGEDLWAQVKEGEVSHGQAFVIVATTLARAAHGVPPEIGPGEDLGLPGGPGSATAAQQPPPEEDNPFRF